MKRTVSVILTLLLLACAMLPVLAAQSPITSPNPIKIKAYDPSLDSKKSAHQVQQGDSYGSHLSRGAPFDGIAY